MRRTIVLLTTMGIAILLAAAISLSSDFGPSRASVAEAQPSEDTDRQKSAAKEDTDHGQAPTESLSGFFNVIWADAPTSGSGDQSPIIEYVLHDGRGNETKLSLDPKLTDQWGGPQALNGKKVKIQGTRASTRGDRLKVQSIKFENSADAREAKAQAAAGAVSAAGPQFGSKPFVTIGCRFNDSPSVTPKDRTYFEGLMGGSRPGADHYWREASYGWMNLTGSEVAKETWYDLPDNRSDYVAPDGTLDTAKALEDCTAAADADVYFPDFYGINIMFNQGVADDRGRGNPSWSLVRDGKTRSYGVTWMPEWTYRNQAYLTHEMGHAFGLKHSSGPYGEVYDSEWDLMSNGSGQRGVCTYKDPTYGCAAPHMNSYHKDTLGWIPEGKLGRKYTAASNSDRTISLWPLAQRRYGGYIMAKIPIDGSTTQFYTVEARRFVGYDKEVPNEAIVIHKVDTSAPPSPSKQHGPSKVVDHDIIRPNGNPNDAGAQWLPGETFSAQANRIIVRVTERTASGYTVRIINKHQVAL